MTLDKARQARRDKAMDRPELRGDGNHWFDPAVSLPDADRLCRTIAVDGDSLPYKLPFPVIYRDGHWFNPRFGDKQLKVTIAKWHYA